MCFCASQKHIAKSSVLDCRTCRALAVALVVGRVHLGGEEDGAAPGSRWRTGSFRGGEQACACRRPGVPGGPQDNATGPAENSVKFKDDTREDVATRTRDTAGSGGVGLMTLTTVNVRSLVLAMAVSM